MDCRDGFRTSTRCRSRWESSGSCFRHPLNEVAGLVAGLASTFSPRTAIMQTVAFHPDRDKPPRYGYCPLPIEARAGSGSARRRPSCRHRTVLLLFRVDGYRRFQRSQKVPARSRNGPGAVVSHNKSIGKNSELWCARGPAVTSGLSNLIRLTSRCVHSESVRQRGRARPDGPPRIFHLSLTSNRISACGSSTRHTAVVPPFTTASVPPPFPLLPADAEWPFDRESIGLDARLDTGPGDRGGDWKTIAGAR
jgi:hypothetical protein